MGLTFSVGVGVVASLVAVIPWLLLGRDPEMIRLVVASSIWAFPMGVAFSGVLALTRRGGSFDRLSLPLFAALGAGAGLLLFGVLAINAADAWTLRTAMGNAAIFVFLAGRPRHPSATSSRTWESLVLPRCRSRGLTCTTPCSIAAPA